MNLVRFSLKQPLIILIFWSLIIFFGVQALFDLPVKFMPLSKAVDIVVTTVYPGADKETVLNEVTKKLERELLEVKGVESVISTTRNENSRILVHFKLGHSIERASSSILVAIERVAKTDFPEGASEPVATVSDISKQVPLFSIAMTSSLSPSEFYSFSERVLSPEFESVEGVSRVAIVGQRQKQMTVKLNLEKMKERQVSASEIVSRLKQVGENTFIGNETHFFLAGEFLTPEDLGSAVVHYFSNDQVVSLRDVAEIQETLTEPNVYAYINGRPCLILEVYAREDANTLNIQRELPKKLDDLRSQLGRSSEEVSFFVLTNREVNLLPVLTDFKKNAWIAIAVSILLIWMVFKDMKSIFISCTSIPASLCGTFLVMGALGMTLNSYTIPALIVSIGLIIDDMIVIRENIFRHLEKGLAPFQATFAGMREILLPVIGTTSMIFAVSLPLILVRGSETTQFLENFGITLFVAMAFSLLEALTLGPLLCAYCLKPHGKEESHTPIQKKIDQHYSKALKFAKEHSKTILAIGGTLTILGFVASSFLASEEMPASVIGDLEMHMQVEKGVPQQVANQKALDFSKKIFHEFPDIEQLGLRVEKNNEMIFYMRMVEESKRQLTPQQLKRRLENLAYALLKQKKIESYFVQAEVTSRSKYLPEYSLRLSSYNSEALKNYSKRLLNRLMQFEGLMNVFASSSVRERETSFIFDFACMNRLGVLTTPVARELDILLNGNEPTFFDPSERPDGFKSEVKVKSELSPTNAKELLKKGYVPNINNTLVPFHKITRKITNEYSLQIQRKNGEEFIEISGDINKQSAAQHPMGYTEKLLKSDLVPPKEIKTSWAGRSEKLKDMMKIEPKIGFLAIFFIYIVLILIYESLTIPLIILLSLPFSVAGSFFALLITGHSINLYSIIGIVVAIGIAAKNGIILIDYTKQLIEQGMEPSKAVYQASKVRLRPILMTSFGVFLVTLPVVLAWDEYAKMQVSLGVAILGGLVTATILSLFLLPLIFKYTYRFHLWVNSWLEGHFNKPPTTIK
jgi:HAE1 family hydrophobic/amphiphilic exporter-1